MKLYAWLTDIHLNFLHDFSRQIFYQEILRTKCDGVFITGDIAEAPILRFILVEMSLAINKPIYFVLGNHDYYNGNVSDVRAEMIRLTGEHKKLYWLPTSGAHRLDKDTFLVGVDGWADGGFGDYEKSTVRLNDCFLIDDFKLHISNNKYELLLKMMELAYLDTNLLLDCLNELFIKRLKKIIILTHVPPFKEVCLYKGEISGDDFLPFFASKIMGELLTNFSQENPQIEFLVLCGHTHSEASVTYGNLTVEVGHAEYRRPRVCKLIGS